MSAAGLFKRRRAFLLNVPLVHCQSYVPQIFSANILSPLWTLSGIFRWTEILNFYVGQTPTFPLWLFHFDSCSKGFPNQRSWRGPPPSSFKSFSECFDIWVWIQFCLELIFWVWRRWGSSFFIPGRKLLVPRPPFLMVLLPNQVSSTQDDHISLFSFIVLTPNTSPCLYCGGGRGFKMHHRAAEQMSSTFLICQWFLASCIST